MGRNGKATAARTLLDLATKAMRLVLLSLIAHVGSASSAFPQSAASYPTEPVRIVVPFGPASGPDFAIRALQPTLQERLKQPVRVENRPGANSIVGTRAVATAAADGHILLGASTGFSTIGATTAHPGFDAMRDFKPVGFSARSAGYLLVVSAKSPYTTMQELIAAARKSPVFYGSPGIGNTLHLVAALFAEKTGTPFKHVPYPGVAEAVLATVRGEVSFAFATLPAVIGQLQSGDLTAIGYAGSAVLAEMPAVPLVSSIAPGFRLAEPWAGLLAPGKTPDHAVTVLNQALKLANEDPRYKTALQAGGYKPAANSPEEFRAFLEQNIADWKQAAQAAGLTPK
jgi:tripartite-type tricarboxylate transporter receptor subunit TctC